MLRRDAGRSLQEAEELALKTLETLLKTPCLGGRERPMVRSPERAPGPRGPATAGPPDRQHSSLRRLSWASSVACSVRA